MRYSKSRLDTGYPDHDQREVNKLRKKMPYIFLTFILIACFLSFPFKTIFGILLFSSGYGIVKWMCNERSGRS